LSPDPSAPGPHGMPGLLQPGLNGAFVAEGFGQPLAVTPLDDRLAGLRLAVKDVFDIAGARTGAGNPAWLGQHAPAASTALPVQLLLASGARFVGKTVTDELAYGLEGRNAHYGTPQNPAGADRLPGGSSSGSAVAVAAGHADIAIGSDFGGSMRLPASYCGTWGIRPTQGRIAKNGGLSLAPSLDTPGWFARSGDHMAAVFAVLAREEIPQPRSATLRVVDDALALCDACVRAQFEALVTRLAGHTPLDRIAAGSLPLEHMGPALNALQASEIWQQHGAWVGAFGAGMGKDVRQRFQMASGVTPEQVTASQRVRVVASSRMARLLGEGDTLLLMPTVPQPAPRLANSGSFAGIRVRSQQMLALSSLSGCPEVSMPWATCDGMPVGLSLIGARGADALVLSAARFFQDFR
jgi:amidase